MKNYQYLKDWQQEMQISRAVYRLPEQFPDRDVYGLTNQLRRSAVPIRSNLAEAHARGSTKDVIWFVNVGNDSLAEPETQLMLARDLGFAANHDVDPILALAEEESRMFTGLKRSLLKKLSNSSPLFPRP